MIILGKEVTCCGDCPMNKSEPNPITRFFPDTHRCEAFIVPEFGSCNFHNRLILNPNIIPIWCPHNDK
jgi:hypothetical protein